MTDLESLRTALSARFPIVCIETHEEPRALSLIRKIADEGNQACHEWSVADGLSHRNFRYSGVKQADWMPTVEGWQGRQQAEDPGQVREFEDTTELQAALHFIDKEGPAGIYVLLDIHPFLEQAAVQRLLREIAFAHPEKHRALVLIGPRITLPPEIARHALFHTLTLPDAKRVRDIFREEIELYAKSRDGRKVDGEQQVANRLVQQLLGLCEEDVRRLLRLSIRDDGSITEADVARVVKVKREMFSDSALEIEFREIAPDAVAGLPNLKRWLALRAKAFGNPQPGLPSPRGVLLLGVQGGGKSLAARTIASSWKVPLARLDIGSLYDKFHGETERNLRNALQAAEALAPCVLWIDEIEKGMAQGSSDTDGGVGRRVLATLLTWMAERDKPVFIAATANDIRALPAELLRKGRFDEIFFVDLPDAAVRADIFAIHLKSRAFDPASFDLTTLASACEGFTGAEIEQAVISACFEAQAGGAMSSELILAELGKTRPLSVVMSEQVGQLRTWASERAVMA
ncbi:AAA family ATPase [Viridibacterium curvum]|uniref:Uncharacterized AAA domain-containing protein ycf46 n=1 Tax=Viridibacterium curvum TaxID=1101404 RepID=A0ABP9R4S2_9RHOO